MSRADHRAQKLTGGVLAKRQVSPTLLGLPVLIIFRLNMVSWMNWREWMYYNNVSLQVAKY